MLFRSDIRELLIDLAHEYGALADRYGDPVNIPFEPGGRGYAACELVSDLMKELEESK